MLLLLLLLLMNRDTPHVFLYHFVSEPESFDICMVHSFHLTSDTKQILQGRFSTQFVRILLGIWLYENSGDCPGGMFTFWNDWYITWLIDKLFRVNIFIRFYYQQNFDKEHSKRVKCILLLCPEAFYMVSSIINKIR